MAATEMRGSARFYTLDGVRGIVALLVALFHYGLRSGGMAPRGYLAVDLFFALSGFVIALNYEGKIRDGRLGLAAFAKMRMVRLYPLYLLGLLIGLVKQAGRMISGSGLDLVPGLWLPASIALGVLVLPTPIASGPIFPHNPPSWSLFLELAVNLLFALVLVRLSTRWLLVLAAVAAAALVVLTTAPNSINLGWDMATLAGGIARVLFSFPIGMLLCRRAAAVTRGTSWLALLPPVALAATMCVPLSPGWDSACELIFVILLFPALLAVSIRLEPPAMFVRPFAFLGDISYPVYAIHFPLVIVFASLGARLKLGTAGGAMLFLGSIIALGAAAAYVYDRPVRAWLARVSRARASAPEQLAPEVGLAKNIG